MSQPNLLELAKQGDPTAIATLMNLTLEPKGVTATASLEDHWLYVWLRSARPLNAKTLVEFTQRGVLSLGIQSVHWVKIHGQNIGADQPSWVETFTVGQPPQPSPPMADEPEVTVDSTDPVGLPSAVHELVARLHTWVEQPALLKTPLQTAWGSALTASQQLAHRVQNWQKQVMTESASSWSTRLRSVNYLKLSMVVTLVAFVTGGTAAIIANSYTVGGSNQKPGQKSAIATDSQLALKSKADRDRARQQSEARDYLETMNKAQQTFYRQNNRLATNLEELERAAALPFTSRSQYTYKLTIHNSTQSQLVAIPKTDGLKSYTAVSILATSTKQVVTAVCASQQPTRVPPLVFQSTNGVVQCPTESAKAL